MGADFESLEACVGDKSDSAKAVADGKRQARQAQRQASALARLAELRSDLPRLTQDLEQGQCVSAFMEASAIMETLRELETQLAPVPTARLRELADGCRKIADTALLRVTSLFPALRAALGSNAMAGRGLSVPIDLPGLPSGAKPLELVVIAPGRFTMGSPASELNRGSAEGPQTQVTISKPFLLGKYEVTQAQWEAVMGSNPSHFKGDPDLPVEQVSWEDALAFCRKLTARAKKLNGLAFSLPTEAQWEYACRAGTSTPFHYGNELRSGMANFGGRYEYLAGQGQTENKSGTYLRKTTRVGSYRANAWGLYDMHGNVWEWCLDWWGDKLPGGSAVDPRGPSTGSVRVYRGGGWCDDGQYCRSADRYGSAPTSRCNYLGFRVALVSVR